MNEILMHLDNFIIIVMDNLFCYSKLLQFVFFAFLMSNSDIQWKERIGRG